MYCLLPLNCKGLCWTTPRVLSRPIPGHQHCRSCLGSGFLSLLLDTEAAGDCNSAVLVKLHPPDDGKSGLHYSVPSNPGAFLACRATSSPALPSGELRPGNSLHGDNKFKPRISAWPLVCESDSNFWTVCFSLKLTPGICLAMQDTDWIQMVGKHFSFEDSSVIYLAISGQFLRNMIHVWRIEQACSNSYYFPLLSMAQKEQDFQCIWLSALARKSCISCANVTISRGRQQLCIGEAREWNWKDGTTSVPKISHRRY